MSAPTREQVRERVMMDFGYCFYCEDGLCAGDSNKQAAHAMADEIVRLRAALAESEQENDDSDAVLTRQSRIMTETANALKGEPKELAMHSTHDLAEVAAQIVAELQRLRTLADDDAAIKHGDGDE